MCDVVSQIARDSLRSKVHVAAVGSSETSVSEKLLLCERQRGGRNYIRNV